MTFDFISFMVRYLNTNDPYVVLPGKRRLVWSLISHYWFYNMAERKLGLIRIL